MMAHAAPGTGSTSRLLTQLSRELTSDLRGYLAEHRARAATSAGGGFESARAYTKLYDGVLSTLFGACHAALAQRASWTPASLAATGSYGRGTLAPFSDLDVRLICRDDPAALAPAAEAIFYPLWDVGLSVGHQVLTISDLLELAAADVTTATQLLDLRSIAGEASFVESALERAYQSVFEGAQLATFIDRLQERARARHERFGDSVYLLEPDVKNGAGGLRDLDTAHWCARARFKVTHLSQLVDLGILLPQEWAEVERARDLLLEIRGALHLCAGRRTDRLTFDLQERVTERLRRDSGPEATERLMSEYYRGARVVTRLAETLLSRARPQQRPRAALVPLGPALAVSDGRVSIERSELLRAQPELAFRAYEEAVQRDLALCEDSRLELMHLAASSEFCAALRASKAASEAFLGLLCVVRQTRLRHGSVLGDLHDVGLLVAMIPEFAPVVGRVHRDTYHVYTVDVHSVAAVDHLRALCRGELAGIHPLASRLAAELPRRRVLFLAALLHDVGKAYGGAGHTTRGVEMAAVILARLGVAASDSADVQTLIEHHLCMYSVATRRDLEDPQTLGEFCAVVREKHALQELYLLTVADVTTTNPTSMTSWKRRMLDALFVAAEQRLLRHDAPPSPRAATVRAAVLEAWPRAEARAFIEHFAAGLPERYFHANEPDAIIEQACFAYEVQGHAASVRRGAASLPYFELWVVADDRPGVLALITATLSHAKVKVRSAQVYSWIAQDGRSRCLDIFWVRGPEDEERAERLLQKLERELTRTLTEPITPAELERRALAGAGDSPFTHKHFKLVVNIDNKAATDYTIIEVITQDRPALLFCLSNALQQLGLSIWFAKINTEGQRVIDVFYVSNAQGGKVTGSDAIERIREQLTAAVEGLQAPASGPGISSAK